MSIEKDRLDKNIQALMSWFKPPNVQKVETNQEVLLRLILTKVIEGEVLTESEESLIWRLHFVKELMKKNSSMRDSRILDAELLYLFEWRKDYPNYKIDSSTKKRIQTILGWIQVGTEAEIAEQNPEPADPDDN